jgi:hypothetical protein
MNDDGIAGWSRIPSLLAAVAAASLASASLGQVTSYSDPTSDIFDTGLSNLDITTVSMSHDADNLYITVETASFQNWTKYMFYFDTGVGGTTSNAWGRPVNLTRDISHYVGSWVDAPSDNAQLWSWNGAWNLDGTVSNDQSQSGENKVTWAFSRSWLGISEGSTIFFDVATSGGGNNDPGVDHLSRSDLATTFWDQPSTSGEFLAYTVPAPGVVAVLALAGLGRSRRRSC